jgi:hypothetical protein
MHNEIPNVMIGVRGLCGGWWMVVLALLPTLTGAQTFHTSQPRHME